jgi:hypothetical protein
MIRQSCHLGRVFAVSFFLLTGTPLYYRIPRIAQKVTKNLHFFKKGFELQEKPSGCGILVTQGME